MQTLKKRSSFLNSEEAKAIGQELQTMMASSLYNTEPTYTSNTFLYPDNLMPFVDKHLNYLNAHPKLDAGMYVSNLRLMTRNR